MTYNNWDNFDKSKVGGLTLYDFKMYSQAKN